MSSEIRFFAESKTHRRKIKKSYYNSAAYEGLIKSAQKNHEKRMQPLNFLVSLKFNNRLQYGVGAYIQGRSNSNLGSVRLMVSLGTETFF